MLRARSALASAALVAALAAPAGAQTPEEIFHQAYAAYEQGRYQEAADAYRALLRLRIRDPAVEFNLGNAEFRLGNLGAAILHYERARRLAPTDADVLANLDYARSLCFDRTETPSQAAVLRWLQQAQDRLGPDRQAWIVLALLWAIAALVAWSFARPGGWNAPGGWALAALLVVLAVVGASWHATLDRLEGRRIGVIVEDAVEVRAGPGASNAALATVHEGLTLEVRAERDEWVQVSLPNGLNGWIHRTALELV
jgi:tetratricopeptide (TPR) repeat protein